MNSPLKKYLLHFRDIMDIVPYLSPMLTIPLLRKWILSFNINFDKACSSYNKRKHRFILDYLEERYGYLIPQTLSVDSTSTAVTALPIWVFWYQGEEHMPPLVKLCIQSVRRNACGRPVYVLDKNNLSNYVSIPTYIYEKLEKGIIKMACFSDIVRLSLLAEHGGHWLDATVFVNKPLREDGLNPYFESIKMPALEKGTISDYRWAGFCLYAHPGATTMCCFRDIMLAYFRDGHRRIIDYLLIDYTFQMMYEKCEDFRQLIDSRPRMNAYTYSLVEVLNEPYQPSLWEAWKGQQFFKLSWKIRIEDKDDTFFYHLVKEEIPT